MWMDYLELAANLTAERHKLTGPPSPELLRFIDNFNVAMDELFAYGRDILHKRRRDPQNDLLSAISRAQVDGELLSDEYLDGSWLLVVFAGNDTTRNTISGTMKLLSEWPEQKRLLIARSELLPAAVNELTRMISPVIYMRRTATRDVELNGQMIGEGEKLLMYYGSANRDDAVFADPDRLDITRPNADKHLAFGYGRHLCLGKRVAQIQLESVYTQILRRFPDMHYAGGMEIAPNNFVHAIRKLPVTFTPERIGASAGQVQPAGAP
jgi:cytochrome P450